MLVAFLIQVMNMTADLRGIARLFPPGLSLVTYAVLFVGGASFAVLYEHRLPHGFRKVSPRSRAAGAEN